MWYAVLYFELNICFILYFLSMSEKLKQIKKNLMIKAGVFLLGLIALGSWFWDYVQANTNLPAWNIIFALDLSNSMNVKDVFYNYHQVSRLELAKKIIENQVKNLDHKFGLVVFSDRFDFFIPPTYDKENFITFLNSLNTSYLNGWKTNPDELFSWLNHYLNKLDQVVILSDFDWDSVPSDKLKNYAYFVWIWKTSPGIVKDSSDRTIFVDNKPLYSSLNLGNLKKLSSHYLVVTDFKKNQILPFLKNLKNKNLLQDTKKIDPRLVVGLLLILLAL